MKKYLFFSKRNGHGRYFGKLIQHPEFNAEIYFFGKFRLPSFRALKQIDNALLKTSISNHVARKIAKHPNLFSMVLVQQLFKKLTLIIERVKLAYYVDLLLKRDPDFVCLWNGDKLPSETVALAAKIVDTQIIYFENGLLPNTTTIDFSGVNAKNSLPRNAHFYLSIPLSEPLKIPTELIIRKPHKNRKILPDKTDLPNRYIFVPFQVPNDTQIIVNSPWIKTMQQLFNEVVIAHQQSSLKDIPLVFKEHPSWPENFSKQLHKPNTYFINNVTTQDLIDGCEFVITINSTVGLESILRNKSVITLGEACYNIEGLVLHAQNSFQLISQLDKIKNWCPDNSLKQRFLYFLHHSYCIPVKWSDADDKHINIAVKRLKQQDRYFKMINSYQTYQELATAINS